MIQIFVCRNRHEQTNCHCLRLRKQPITLRLMPVLDEPIRCRSRLDHAENEDL